MAHKPKTPRRKRRSKGKPRHAGNARTFRPTPLLATVLEKAETRTGISINKLTNHAAAAAFAAAAGAKNAIRDFAALMQAAEANRKTQERTKQLTTASARAMREATNRLRQAVGTEPAHPPEPHPARQSA